MRLVQWQSTLISIRLEYFFTPPPRHTTWKRVWSHLCGHGSLHQLMEARSWSCITALCDPKIGRCPCLWVCVWGVWVCVSDEAGGWPVVNKQQVHGDWHEERCAQFTQHGSGHIFEIIRYVKMSHVSVLCSWVHIILWVYYVLFQFLFIRSNDLSVCWLTFPFSELMGDLPWQLAIRKLVLFAWTRWRKKLSSANRWNPLS